MGQANTAGHVRDLAVDLYRVGGLVLIVVGHWLLACMTYHDGHFGLQDGISDMPWTAWLSWIFQAVPVFFLVAGYAGAVSWTHRCDADGMSRQAWLGHRLARVLGPTAVYVALVSVIVVVLQVLGLPGSMLKLAGWALGTHLWFLAVYVLVVSLTPIAIAAHRRWGLLVPGVLAVGVAAVDAAAVHGHVPYIGWLNCLLCWGLLYQLGIAWHSGSLVGRMPVLLASGSAVALALLIWLGPYQVSMVDVAVHGLRNAIPPTVAMLAFGCAQAGVVVTLAPALNRALRTDPVQRALSAANSKVMLLYLWHMVPVVVVAFVGYRAGLFPQPIEGSAAWWWFRLEWVFIIGLAAAVEMALLWWGRRVFAAPLPMLPMPLRQRWAEPVTLAGASMAAYGLWLFAHYGFAPAGHLAWVTALLFAVGLALVVFRPAEVTGDRPADRALRME
ncbi:acyltransferase [Mycobacterium sp. 663a-19]|uniref:acyltransferase n=1 Tax=Mycobacterium sp. 663a-19 TaxID=2986148 RepID=UPI002D1EB0CA|nr:acyltransferase [Mycobacterium sp. 663a-19]MEB3984359.1 acyltransferase [Mycobacterium sp. 663a-19]